MGAAAADDLDVVVDPGSSPQARGDAYRKLIEVEFATIAAKLARLMGRPVLSSSGIGPTTKEPWSESRLSESDRITFTLSQLWRHHTEATPEPQLFDLMMTLIEDASLGTGRRYPLEEIRWRLDFRPSPRADLLPRLDKLARDPAQLRDFRLQLVRVLFQNGDPNLYLDLAIEMSSAEDRVITQSQTFRGCAHGAFRLSKENKGRFLRHAFKLLEALDDGRSGHGYFLALDIGACIGVPPVKSGQGPFAPDRRLEEYKGETGLDRQFFQDTVNNARAWWREHQSEFGES